VLALSLILVAAAGPVAADTGPYLVKDINTSGSSSPRELTELNGKVYFSASGGAKGRELWVSDGTANGTRRVKDIRPGSQGSQPFGLIASNGLMYFNANDGTTGQELWVTDGTTTGTRLVKDIGPGVASGNPLFFTPVNGTVFFSADDGVKGRELWRTDGSEAGTQLVKDIVPGMQGSTPWELTEFADKLVFRATRCPTATCVTTLFKSNGTAAGTKPFKDRDGHLVTGDIHDLRVVGSQLYFYKDEGEIWRSKGDSSTLRSLGDFDPSTPIVDSGNRAFFTVGFELWKSNGTPGGTVKVTQVDTDWPEDLFDLDGTLFFWAGALYRSDGTAEGTVQVGPDHQSLYLEADQMAALDGFLYYAGLSVHQGSCLEGDRTLWRSDGTPSGTLEVSPTPEACNLGYLTPLDGALFFAAGDGVSNVELWRYVP
jgi:ELWxxDGT repeat protein